MVLEEDGGDPNHLRKSSVAKYVRSKRPSTGGGSSIFESDDGGLVFVRCSCDRAGVDDGVKAVAAIARVSRGDCSGVFEACDRVGEGVMTGADESSQVVDTSNNFVFVKIKMEAPVCNSMTYSRHLGNTIKKKSDIKKE
ncbi:hypothetical protein L6452_17803 [Arctium lappa]|uniref:Uncharacterized protein n=1 Tax=Arctium lappa TaxID=4217 RepID=A0ACB9C4N6_ARCLA|nr:hypothetical protein L6452_17803 [Arctium lappa]